MRAEDILNKSLEAKVLNKIGAFIRDEAKRRCPVDNGQLRNSLQYEVDLGDSSVTIFSDLNYAPFVEYGTGVFHIDEEGNPQPHMGWDVEPVEKKALHFRIGKNEVFAKKVHIEGMQAQPFLRPAVHQNMSKIKSIIAEELQK